MPKLFKGNIHKDIRGRLYFNNSFDASDIKRVYIIENINTDTIRGWQGHKIEQRWFSAIKGTFIIKLIKIDNWDCPSFGLECQEKIIESKQFDILHVPRGYVSSIKSIEKDSKLLVMADYFLGEIEDEYRFDIGFFDA